MVAAGAVIVLETLLPLATADMQVDGHSSATHTTTRDGTRSQDTSYNLQFVGEKPVSCSVGYVAYDKLHDGDTVSVTTTKIFKKCVTIKREGDLVYSMGSWKFFAFIVGLILIACAFGKVDTDGDGSFTWSWN